MADLTPEIEYELQQLRLKEQFASYHASQFSMPNISQMEQQKWNEGTQRCVSTPSVSCQPEKPIGYGAFGAVWSVTDPQSGKQLALKKIPNVFQNFAQCKRVFREITMLHSFKHQNVIALVDITPPQDPGCFKDLCILTELMEKDLHSIIISPQPLSVEHVKLFVYQILRGLKYLHSANVLHRDLKPANLLVNSDCTLKICDFGLARVWNPHKQEEMSNQVVTQYYRAPELLMGARKYTDGIDMWSVGCIFAELMGRRILFEAAGPMEQLAMVIDLLGTPAPDDIKLASQGARAHVNSLPKKIRNASESLLRISSEMNEMSVDLLTRFLAFNPDKRLTVTEALDHPFLQDGRARFHLCMCSCCVTLPTGCRQFAKDLEPAHLSPFDPSWEEKLNKYTMFQLQEEMYNFVVDRHRNVQIQ